MSTNVLVVAKSILLLSGCIVAAAVDGTIGAACILAYALLRYYEVYRAAQRKRIYRRLDQYITTNYAPVGAPSSEGQPETSAPPAAPNH